MKIAILGYGKMGKTIEQLAVAKGHQIVLKITQDNSTEGTATQLKEADVAIEFSRPEVAFDNIAFCLSCGVPVVSGTTGWLDKMPEIEKMCTEQEGAFFYASNFSIGVNIFFSINQRLAQLMNDYPEYNIDLEEVHHTQKKDAPSGTGITLANDIIEAVGRKEKWVNQATDIPSELPLLSKRIDQVPGTHHIRYSSPIDDIEISHTAHSRIGFASGALLAAEWLPGRKGCFGMKQLLNL